MKKKMVIAISFSGSGIFSIGSSLFDSANINPARNAPNPSDRPKNFTMPENTKMESIIKTARNSSSVILSIRFLRFDAKCVNLLNQLNQVIV
ncbi:MAG TPA: hypothetical protein VH878_04085 [Thermodesulfobacteriota bacterium]|jgi:hypothetical protein